eukprot:189429-Chlamydomonas_euryale.AAC.7
MAAADSACVAAASWLDDCGLHDTSDRPNVAGWLAAFLSLRLPGRHICTEHPADRSAAGWLAEQTQSLASGPGKRAAAVGDKRWKAQGLMRRAWCGC